MQLLNDAFFSLFASPPSSFRQTFFCGLLLRRRMRKKNFLNQIDFAYKSIIGNLFSNGQTKQKMYLIEGGSPKKWQVSYTVIVAEIFPPTILAFSIVNMANRNYFDCVPFIFDGLSSLVAPKGLNMVNEWCAQLLSVGTVTTWILLEYYSNGACMRLGAQWRRLMMVGSVEVRDCVAVVFFYRTTTWKIGARR